MNPNTNANTNADRHDNPPDLGRLIDRLVDGELSDADRRALLLRLETEPDGQGWRRCALAFLESLDWREALGTHAAPPAATAPTSDLAGQVPPRNGQGGRAGSVGRWLAMAATVAGAFLLGRAGAPAGNPGPAATPLVAAPVAANLPAASQEAGDESEALDPIDADSLALDGREPSNPWADPGSYWRPSPSATARGGGAPWAWSNTPAPVEVPELPAPVVEDWRRRGYEVETRPRYVSVGTEGSRAVPVPVNEVRLRYVGDRTY